MAQSESIFPMLLVPICLVQGVVCAAENGGSPDKSAFNLFNPVPKDLMRELAPDRPDQTESAYTVDAGHFQLEMDFFNFTYNRAEGQTTRAWNIAPVNLKAGLLNNVDLQFVFDNYLHVDTGGVTQSGFGDFTTRLKINLWGNDGGRTAFALLPYVKFPTSTDHLGNDSVEAGVIFPFAMELPREFGLGAGLGAGIFRDANHDGHHEEFIVSATVGHSIIGKLSGYVEFFGNFSTERHSGWIGTMDFGLGFLVTENVQLDCGCNVGLSPAADSAHAFSGLTFRF